MSKYEEIGMLTFSLMVQDDRKKTICYVILLINLQFKKVAIRKENEWNDK